MKTYLLLLTTLLVMNTFGQDKSADNKDIKRVEKSDAEWKEEMTEFEFYVMRQKGTERPFTGKYDNFYEKGHYDCAACGLTLFDSDSKFKSGCGWPSFSDELLEGNIKFIEDRSHGMVRTEVQCAACDAHLGHVFNDGPPPTGLRYCINSISIKFVKETDE